MGNTVQVLYTSCDRRFTEREWERHFFGLPTETQTRIRRYHRLQDRQARLAGYLLLREGLQGRGYDLKSDVSTDHFGRPYVNHDVDFNISHTDGWVVCALTCRGRLGIDIEKIKPIDVSDFRNYMSFDQMKKNDESESIYETFYDFWTIKESAMKADGRGLSIPLQEVKIRANKAVLEGKSWFVRKLSISPECSCHLACDLEYAELEMKEIDFEVWAVGPAQERAYGFPEQERI
jgi:4'-phosphopantetheinyl transferase